MKTTPPKAAVGNFGQCTKVWSSKLMVVMKIFIKIVKTTRNFILWK